MNTILKNIQKNKLKGHKLLAILLDPDKLYINDLPETLVKINKTPIDYIFVGGSAVTNGITEIFVAKIRELSELPIVLFPGDYSQLTNHADSVLFLSLLSGNNPEYLIGQQVKSVDFLKKSSLEIIPTGYILIEGGVKSSVQVVSKTTPIPQKNVDEIVHTALAGQFLGKSLIYLEAGSGARTPVDMKIISSVSTSTNLPIIVGGGIRTKKQLTDAYNNGADIVVIGTAFENDQNFLEEISQ